MVFVAGPRQVGKTTLARALRGGRGGHLDWDIDAHRARFLAREFPRASLWILDEIHKYKSWRALLKGLYDGRRRGQRILVTGSARLDLHRRGGDSLPGRYHLLRLHPLSVAELGSTRSTDLDALLALGGFPEPFFGGSEVLARRGSREYRSRLVREDVTGLERVQDLGNLELLMMRRPAVVGSPLSVNAVREDLQVSHKTVANWLGMLERLYAIFLVPPLSGPRIRAVKQAQKHDHFDWSLVPEAPQRFENLVASHLLKWVHFQEDAQARELELCYFRDTDGREVDFVVRERGQPRLLIEVKSSAGAVDPNLRHLKHKYPAADAWQLHAQGQADFVSAEGIRVAPALELLRTLV